MWLSYCCPVVECGSRWLPIGCPMSAHIFANGCPGVVLVVSYGMLIVCLWVPVVLLWLSCACPVVGVRWVSYCFPMLFLWLIVVVPVVVLLVYSCVSADFLWCPVVCA